MDVLLWITTILLVLGVGGVAAMKLSGNEEVVKQAHLSVLYIVAQTRL